MASRPIPEGFTSQPRVILVADLSGYHRGYRTHSDAEMAHFLDRFYTMCGVVIEDAGGTIIKFMGDALLAVFDANAAAAAASAAVTLESLVDHLAVEHELELRFGANLHFGKVILSELGRGSTRRLDVIGQAVNRCFLLGRGRGIRISEPVYRKLPSGDRTPWEKHKPPAVYALGELGAHPYSRLGRSPEEMAVDW